MTPTAAWLLTVPLVIRSRSRGRERATGHRPLTTNDRLHWRVKARYVAEIRESVAWRARQAHIPPQEHVTVQLHYAPGDARRRDAPNLVATSKPAVDALVDAGVVPDDTARWVEELMPVLHVPTGVLHRVRSLWLTVEASPAVTLGLALAVQSPRGAPQGVSGVSRDRRAADGRSGGLS